MVLYHRNTHKSVTGVLQDVVGLQILYQGVPDSEISYRFSRYTHKLIFTYSNEKRTAFLGSGIDGDRGGIGLPGQQTGSKMGGKTQLK